MSSRRRMLVFADWESPSWLVECEYHYICVCLTFWYRLHSFFAGSTHGNTNSTQIDRVVTCHSCLLD
eukprot:scaffold5839_cov49-Attheya_sp.AAC.3